MRSLQSFVCVTLSCLFDTYSSYANDEVWFLVKFQFICLVCREQLDSLEKLKWPDLSYKGVPWASRSPSCNLHSWSLLGLSPNQSPSLPVIETEQVREPIEAGHNGSTKNTNDQPESAKEDGELPSLALIASAANDVKVSSRGSSFGNSKQLVLMSKSISPVTKAKPLSFKKQDKELDIMLDPESDIDEPAHIEPEMESTSANLAGDSWIDCGAREYCLVLTRKLDTDERFVRLEAKVLNSCLNLENISVSHCQQSKGHLSPASMVHISTWTNISVDSVSFRCLTLFRFVFCNCVEHIVSIFFLLDFNSHQSLVSFSKRFMMFAFKKI